MATPFEIPANAPSPFVAPNGFSVYHFDVAQEAEAQQLYDRLTTEPVQFPDGQNRPMNAGEILFFKWLGKCILALLIPGLIIFL